MSQNATASWSGYSHQGKVGLLIALKAIRTLNCEGLDGYYIEYETHEDVKLVEAANDLQVHQVKAYVSGTTKGPYTDALEAFHPCPGSNFLHTVCEITNWDTLTPAQNPHGVERYPYAPDRNYCSLEDIESYILTEIRAILQHIHHAEADSQPWAKQGYFECQDLLDAKIRHEHANKVKADYQIRLSLPEIFDLVRNPPVRQRMATCAIRAEIFQQYVIFIQDLSANPPMVLPPNHETFVKETIEKICSLNDRELELFLNQIFPYSTYGKTLGSTMLTDSFFTSSGFFTPFLHALIHVQNTPLTLEGNTYPHYKGTDNYLLTALQNAELEKKKVAKNILIHDKLNTARYEARYIITEHYTGPLTAIAPRILEKPISILSPQKLDFITVQDAIQTLN